MFSGLFGCLGDRYDGVGARKGGGRSIWIIRNFITLQCIYCL